MAGTFVKVARAEDIAPGTSIAVELPEAALAIANVDGQFFAIENLCTHDDGPLGEGEPSTGSASNAPGTLPISMSATARPSPCPPSWTWTASPCGCRTATW